MRANEESARDRAGRGWGSRESCRFNSDGFSETNDSGRRGRLGATPGKCEYFNRPARKSAAREFAAVILFRNFNFLERRPYYRLTEEIFIPGNFHRVITAQKCVYAGVLL